MGEFFRGWRRKFGLVTLVVACVFAAGWVRSLTATDQLHGCNLFGQLHSFGSQSAAFYWIRLKQNPPSSTAMTQGSDPVSQSIFRKLWFMDIEVRQASGGIIVATGKGTGIPYWIITIPLTLLSAYLLLSKRTTFSG